MAQVLKDEVKEKIQSSAVDLFTLHGYKNTSIKKIAANAQVSVGNVYRYYKNKDELYESVIKGVYDGVHDLMKLVEEQENYHILLSNKDFIDHVYDPMVMFIELYRREKKVFTMLVTGEKGYYYEKTILSFIEILRDYFYRFWGQDNREGGITYIEASALTHALVFSVIDIINNVEEDELELHLIQFVPRLIKGYFVTKNNKEES